MVNVETVELGSASTDGTCKVSDNQGHCTYNQYSTEYKGKIGEYTILQHCTATTAIKHFNRHCSYLLVRKHWYILSCDAGIKDRGARNDD